MRACSLVLLALALSSAACGKAGGGESMAQGAPAADPADGPASIALPATLAVSTDPAIVKKGEALFAGKGCTACHKIGGGKLVGPDLQGVTARRSTRWIARMILHPEVMLREDPTAKQLLATHLTPMSAQGVEPESELPALLSYLKSKER